MNRLGKYHQICIGSSLLIAFLCISFPVFGQRKAATEQVWKSTPGKKGLYSRNGNYFVSNGIAISFSPTYYYGDVDIPGIAFNGGFQLQNLNMGGTLSFSYIKQQSNLFNWRFSLLGGWLSGDNSAIRPNRYRKFHSTIVEAGAGIEYYPFNITGLYIYGGVALTYGYIKYDFMSTSGTRSTVVPMIPVGAGYTFGLGSHFIINLEILAHQAVCDTKDINLDGYPTTGVGGIQIGTRSGNKFADGYFSFGITVAYKWHTCPECRVYRW